jgi:hypothetical protein
MRNVFLYAICIVLVTACGRSYRDAEETDKEAAIRENFLRTNQYIVRNEAEYITEFIGKHSWNLKKTGTGLRYESYDSTAGPRPGRTSLV